MDDLFDIFINSVVNQYDLRTAGTAANTANTNSNNLLEMYNMLNRSLNEASLDPLNAIRNTDILDPFDEDDPVDILRNIRIRDPFDVDPPSPLRRRNDILARPFEDDDLAVNRSLIDNLYAVRRYYESLARRPIRTLSDLILDELNIEMDLADLSNLEDVKVVLTQEQFDSLEHFHIGDQDKYDKCNICLDEFCSENLLVKLNCKHVFHEPCIKTWLTTQSKKCPVCRSEQ